MTANSDVFIIPKKPKETKGVPMAAEVVWDDAKIREKCKEGTSRQLQAYIEEGYIQLNGFPIQPSHLSSLIETPVQEDPPPVEYFLVDDFTGNHMMIEVAHAVCKKHNVTLNALRGHARSRDLVVARRELYYICYFKLGKSTSQIGKAFNRDHTTIVHHLQVCCGKRSVQYFRGKYDEKLRPELAAFRQ